MKRIITGLFTFLVLYFFNRLGLCLAASMGVNMLAASVTIRLLSLFISVYLWHIIDKRFNVF